MNDPDFDVFTDEPQAKAQSNGADKAPRRPRFKLVSFSELTVGSRAVSLVKGIIPKAGLIVIWGPPKCGKSYWIFTVMLMWRLAGNIAAVASSKAWWSIWRSRGRTARRLSRRVPVQISQRHRRRAGLLPGQGAD